MRAAIAGTIRPHSTSQERTAGIESAIRITDHKPMSPGHSIFRALLRLHHQRDGADLVATVVEPIAMPPLQNEIGGLIKRKPATRLRWIIHLNAMKQYLAVRLAKLNQHGRNRAQRSADAERVPS
jgi:hypothetical protein